MSSRFKFFDDEEISSTNDNSNSSIENKVEDYIKQGVTLEARYRCEQMNKIGRAHV